MLRDCFLRFLVAGVTTASSCLACGASESPSPGQPAAVILLEGEALTTGSLALRPAFAADERQTERQTMVERQIAARGVEDPATLAALRKVPRHEFVPTEERSRAYADHPLPIGHGQTISQPFIVGFMTEMLRLGPESRVLEVGTGSGYQAAILGEIAGEVVTIEIIDGLARPAAERLRSLGYANITAIHGDGYFGHEARAPYDAIIVTAAAEHTPPPLLGQLKPGGRMVIPVGRAGWTQNLLVIEKSDAGEVTTRNVMPVVFVPLTRGAK